MADRGGDHGPYVGAVALWRWLSEPRTWRAFDGYCALRGVDPADLPLGRLLRAAYAYLIRGHDLEGVETIDAILEGRAVSETAAPPAPHFERPSVAPGGEVSPAASVGNALVPPVNDPTMLSLMGLMGRESEFSGGG